jgi:hypothetical protein
VATTPFRKNTDNADEAGHLSKREDRTLADDRPAQPPTAIPDVMLAQEIRQYSRSEICDWSSKVRISASSCSRSPALNRTTYLFTEISFAAMIALHRQ